MRQARFLTVRGVVQGVGFRPFVFRLARNHGLAGWVRNAAGGVEIHVEGEEEALAAFVRELADGPPPAARIASLDVSPAPVEDRQGFAILESEEGERPTVRISPDLPVCAACLRELFEPADRRHGYPYINCTDCGPRYSIILGLPYDRPRTTMQPWPMCPDCEREYHDPLDRRFHAQPVACPACGPGYRLIEAAGTVISEPPAPATTDPTRAESPVRSAGWGAEGGRGLLPRELRASAGQDSWESATDPARSDRRRAPNVQKSSERAPVPGRSPRPPSAGGQHSGPESFFLNGAAGTQAIEQAARLLSAGEIVAIKGLGGYHLAADAANPATLAALRERKIRKEKPFAVMAKDLAVAHSLVVLSPEAETLLTSIARPIVLAPARRELPGVAPENPDLGVMLPYAPVHHLLFAAGAPDLLVMTSANRSSEPLAYRDDEARERLAGIADAFLVGERPIARRVDDSVVRAGSLGPVVLRRARGLAPGAVARLPIARPVLALGADLKNTVTLVVGGEAFVSQHLGDLTHHEARQAFHETVRDLTAMYEVDWGEVLVMHDLHPGYASTAHALELPAAETRGVQHHRAHVASVLAERGALEERVLGVACDGTGYGDDGGIWGGEFFVGSVAQGFERVAHLRPAVLPGGDAAARNPVQCAAGFLAQVEDLPDLTAPPFHFPERYLQARELVAKQVRTFPTTSLGRLFDTVAALLGFTRLVTFEGQAAIWLEHLARGARAAPAAEGLPFPFDGRELDFRPALAAVVEARRRGQDPAAVARAFHHGLARGLAGAVLTLAEAHGLETVVLSGGVFQNELLLDEIGRLLAGAAGAAGASLRLWTNREVPPNDEGISLGQAALALTGLGSVVFP